MKFGTFESRENGEHNAVGFVGIYSTFFMQAMFFLLYINI